MDDPFLVCCLQRLCNFCGDLQDLLQRQRPPTQPVHQHFTFHVFHNYEVLTFELTDFVDVADIGMIQSGCGTGLAQETLLSDRILLHLRWQELQGDFPIQRNVLCQIHHSHAAFADFLHNSVVQQRPACVIR